ncbi:hypothetical protein [Streptomyces lunaelactis]|nr:hypothetical protein [Streptomyces lunaelactis]NUK83940.1 hypothetical protein [Streptomyces lunaelactis]
MPTIMRRTDHECDANAEHDRSKGSGGDLRPVAMQPLRDLKVTLVERRHVGPVRAASAICCV